MSEDFKKDHYEDQSFVRFNGEIGGLLSFNADFGYLEALVRGFRSGFLKEYEYRQLCQCESLDDVKLTLSDTDYMNALQNVHNLTPDVITDRCWQKFVDEFDHIRSQATGQLATFLDFISFQYMNENISFLVTSLIRGARPDLLIAKCNPLGRFPRMKSILTFENTEDGLIELYRTVLVDTPVARYFERYFDTQLRQGLHELQRVYNEVEIDIITNMLQKLWLEDFYQYTQSLGGDTAVFMKELLEFEADRRAIHITINSFGTQLNEAAARQSERKALYCCFGKLYPEGINAFTEVTDMNRLATALEDYPIYFQLLSKAQSEGKEFEDVLTAYEVHLNRLAFEEQSHFAAFYAFVKLKEQEKRNVYWIVQLIHQKQMKDAKNSNKWVKIF